MADPSNLRENSMRFRKSLSKMAFRNKERVMRSIGRAEETKDEILDHYVMLINKQQIQMQKLQRDMKQYLQALKAMGLAQRAFYTSLYEVYDEGWEGKDVVGSCSKRSEALYEDIFARFQSEVLELLHNHLTEYQKCRVSIEKRGRKLVDYDAAKRTVQALESAKKTDYPKLEKSKESLQQARDVYEDLNNFLHQQLPALHDSRLTVCVNVFSSICESEGVFSSEVAELRTKLNNVLLNLKSSFDNGEYRIQRMQTPLDNGLVPAESESPSTSTASHMKVPPPLPASSSPPKFEKMNPRTQSENGQAKQHDDPSTHEYVNLQVGVMPDTVKPVSEDEEFSTDETSNKKKFPIPGHPQAINDDQLEIPPIYEEPPREEILTKPPSKASDQGKITSFPPNYLFSVKALYQYRSSDDDELSFSKGDIIYIIEHPDPEEQDDGWQMGIRQVDWEQTGQVNSCMGVFPENFTKRIELQ